MNRDAVLRWLENRIGLVTRVAGRGSRNATRLDAVCRKIAAFLLKPKGEDFMRDPLVDNDVGFDPDELERYSQGKDAASS
ncbi:MAG: hypothetical protein AAFU79_05505 [Myxococcota bacterium]